MWRSLLFISITVYAATIPPGVPSVSPCLQKCFEEGSILQAANDLNNFKNIAINIDMFCQVNTAVLKCGRECPDIAELETRTAYSSFICSEKIEEFRLIKDCMSNAPESVDSCMQECGLPAAALRFDSSPAALVSPTAFFDGIGETCDKHICSLKCSMDQLEKACPGTGSLLKDIGRFQVTTGIEHLNTTAQKENETNQQIVMNYLKNLPAKCAFMQDAELFDLAITSATKSENDDEEKSVEKSEERIFDISTEAPIEFQGDATVTTASSAETTLEFEPSNEPDIPIGPPEVGGTVEPTREVEGQPETDEFIIDHDGRAKTNFAKPTTQSAEESTTEKITQPDNDLAPMSSTVNPDEGEPVIVIENTENATDSNDIADSTAAEVKSGSISFAAVAVLVLSAVFAL